MLLESHEFGVVKIYGTVMCVYNLSSTLLVSSLNISLRVAADNFHSQLLIEQALPIFIYLYVLFADKVSEDKQETEV